MDSNNQQLSYREDFFLQYMQDIQNTTSFTPKNKKDQKEYFKRLSQQEDHHSTFKRMLKSTNLSQSRIGERSHTLLVEGQQRRSLSNSEIYIPLSPDIVRSKQNRLSFQYAAPSSEKNLKRLDSFNNLSPTKRKKYNFSDISEQSDSEYGTPQLMSKMELKKGQSQNLQQQQNQNQVSSIANILDLDATGHSTTNFSQQKGSKMLLQQENKEYHPQITAAKAFDYIKDFGSKEELQQAVSMVTTKEEKIKLIDDILNQKEVSKNIEQFVKITKNASLINRFIRKLRPIHTDQISPTNNKFLDEATPNNNKNQKNSNENTNSKFKRRKLNSKSKSSYFMTKSMDAIQSMELEQKSFKNKTLLNLQQQQKDKHNPQNSSKQTRRSILDGKMNKVQQRLNLIQNQYNTGQLNNGFRKIPQAFLQVLRQTMNSQNQNNNNVSNFQSPMPNTKMNLDLNTPVNQNNNLTTNATLSQNKFPHSANDLSMNSQNMGGGTTTNKKRKVLQSFSVKLDTGGESVAYADSTGGGSVGSRPVNLKRVTEKCKAMLEQGNSNSIEFINSILKENQTKLLAKYFNTQYNLASKSRKLVKKDSDCDAELMNQLNPYKQQILAQIKQNKLLEKQQQKEMSNSNRHSMHTSNTPSQYQNNNNTILKTANKAPLTDRQKGTSSYKKITFNKKNSFENNTVNSNGSHNKFLGQKMSSPNICMVDSKQSKLSQKQRQTLRAPGKEIGEALQQDLRKFFGSQNKAQHHEIFFNCSTPYLTNIENQAKRYLDQDELEIEKDKLKDYKFKYLKSKRHDRNEVKSFAQSSEYTNLSGTTTQKNLEKSVLNYRPQTQHQQQYVKQQDSNHRLTTPSDKVSNYSRPGHKSTITKADSLKSVSMVSTQNQKKQQKKSVISWNTQQSNEKEKEKDKKPQNQVKNIAQIKKNLLGNNKNNNNQQQQQQTQQSILKKKSNQYSNIKSVINQPKQKKDFYLDLKTWDDEIRVDTLDSIQSLQSNNNQFMKQPNFYYVKQHNLLYNNKEDQEEIKKSKSSYSRFRNVKSSTSRDFGQKEKSTKNNQNINSKHKVQNKMKAQSIYNVDNQLHYQGLKDYKEDLQGDEGVDLDNSYASYTEMKLDQLYSKTIDIQNKINFLDNLQKNTDQDNFNNNGENQGNLIVQNRRKLMMKSPTIANIQYSQENAQQKKQQVQQKIQENKERSKGYLLQKEKHIQSIVTKKLMGSPDYINLQKQNK